jgi:hypothetical protein
MNLNPAVAFAQDAKTFGETICSQFLSITRKVIGDLRTHWAVIPANAGIHAQKKRCQRICLPWVSACAKTKLRVDSRRISACRLASTAGFRTKLPAVTLALTLLAITPLQAIAEDAAQPPPAKPKAVMNPAPTAQDWADLAKFPDWSGVWNPKITDQEAQVRTNMPPWKPEIAAKIQFMLEEEKAGRPTPIVVSCLPEAMPAWMLISHNAMEILFTPGRVTMLGEADGNRLRRIYTDGRGHPEDPDPTFHGHSVGRWEGDTLVVETVNIKSQTMFAVSEAAGVPNNGDMKIVERIHLAGPDVLHFDIEIDAPHVLTKPWNTTRIWFRQRARKFDIVEGVCLEGNYSERLDKDGNHIFVEIERHPWGNIQAPKK